MPFPPRVSCKTFRAALFGFLFSLSFAFAAYGNEQIIVAITLNEQTKGEFFVLLRPDGDFFVLASDLAAIGITTLPTSVEIDGYSYISLGSMQGLTFNFDESTLTLNLMATPSLLATTILDFSVPRRPDVIYPRDNSIFLNYGIDYSAGGEEFEFEGVNISNELGIRHRDLLFLTETTYSESPDDSRFVRLNSSMTWDDRQTLRRLIVGDFFALSGELGSRQQLGGVSFSKLYRLDPYFIRYPLFDFSGMASLPSDLDLYVNGMRVRSERFAPGEFELQNFQSIGGAQTIEIVVRDALGREQRIVSPFYFTDQILRQGLHEYSYNLGLLRRDFGQKSSDYSDLAFSAFHRYGFSDFVNLGWHGEAGDGIVNLGLETAIKVGSFGLLRLEATGSRQSADSGTAGFLSYEYYNRRFRGRLAVQGFSSGYRTLADTGISSRRKLDILGGIGFVMPTFGSFGLDYAKTENYEGAERQTITLSWSRRLWKGTYVNALFRQIQENETNHEGGINLTWYFGADHSVSGAVRQERRGDVQVLEARKNTPVGEGTGWNLRGERTEHDGTRNYLAEAVIQRNAPQAIIRGDFSMGRSETLATEDFRLVVAGALVQVGDTVALTRPVSDSFAMVSVGSTEGVRIYANGQTIGRTDRRGRAIVPVLTSYYENQITIEDKDIPINFLMPRVRLDVSPPYRSGSCLNFPLRPYQAFTGTIALAEGGEKKSLVNAELTLSAPAGKLTFWTGNEGEYYLDSQEADFDLDRFQGCKALKNTIGPFLPPGKYPISIRKDGRHFETEIAIPATTEVFAETGEIVLPVPGSPPAQHIGATISTPDHVPAPLAPSVSKTEKAGAETTSKKDVGIDVAPSLQTSIPEASENFPISVIHFAFDEIVPLSEDLPVLSHVVHQMLANGKIQIDIEGHTCRKGPAARNKRLGWRRALAVEEHLIAAGIEASRITVRSFGEEKPACRQSGEECLRQNRRAVLTMAKNREN